MKKLLFVITVFALCLSVGILASPEAVEKAVEYDLAALFPDESKLMGEYGNLSYSVSNGYDTITGCSFSPDVSVVIPSEIDGYPVTSIGNYAFSYCTSLESIEIPNSVASIGEYAFYGCTSLESVRIPVNVSSLENYSFAYCDNLDKIIIPRSVTEIAGNALFFSYNATIYGYTDSYAETYANENNIPFVAFYGEALFIVSDIVSVDVVDLLDIELLYYDDEKSYIITLSFDSGNEDMSDFFKEFNSLHVYSENDMPENHSLEINLFFFTDDNQTIYDSENKGLSVSDSNEVYYIRFDDLTGILEELGLEWEENNAGSDMVVHPYLKGDVDKSCSIDANDAILLLQHSMFPELYPLDYTENVDFTCDGVVDMSDAILLLQHSMFPDLFPLD